MKAINFPEQFTWGVAAAAYQIEGAAAEDGKGASVWDMMCRQPGRIGDGNSGEVACDHYHLYKEDVAMMKSLGVKAYRLSISWPRVLPEGTGTPNQKGLEFYDNLINELLAAGIEPWVTLFHWDYPYDLYCRGGWLNSESVNWFTDYTRLIVDRFSDRVTNWITFNEPQCFAGLGHFAGAHAPGDKLGLQEYLRISHHVLLSHGRATQVIRAHAKKPPKIGWAPVGVIKFPADENNPADVEAARQAMFKMVPHNPNDPHSGSVIWNNTWWADPVFKGQYPEDGMEIFGKAAPRIQAGDMETIAQPIDFYGVNIYAGSAVRAGADGQAEGVNQPQGAPETHIGWPVAPQSLYWGSRFLYERYQRPLVITENGLSSMDWVTTEGKVHDLQRIDFLTRYLRELGRSIADGVDVGGYFHWSIMDNFEWAYGYKHRFGLVHVDYATQKRTLKDSALWYKEVMATNGRNL